MLGTLLSPFIASNLVSIGHRLERVSLAWIQSQRQLQERVHQAQVEREIRRDFLRAKADLELNRLLLKYQNDREIENLRSELRQKEDRDRLIRQYQAAHSPADSPPGKWLETTFPQLPGAPLVLFNTHLINNPVQDINPLPFVYRRFNDFANLHGCATVRSFGNRSFSADDAIDQFYHRELNPLPTIVVTGTFDGHAVAVQASVFGLQPNQLAWPDGKLSVSGDTITLGRFTQSLFNDLLAEVSKDADDASRSLPGLKARATETFQRIHSLVVNTSLQMIIDDFLSRSGFQSIEPLAKRVYEQELSHCQHFVMSDQETKEIIGLLSRHSSLCRDSRVLEHSRRTLDRSEIVDDADSNRPRYDEDGPTLWP